MTEPAKDPGIAKKPGVMKPEEKPETASTKGEGWAVVLFDDASHYREDVVLQVMKAIRCAIDTADTIVARVERRGHGIVTIADHAEAIRVAGILHEIRLKTELRQIN